MLEYLTMCVQYAREVLEGFDFRFEGTKVALITFGDVANISFQLDDYNSQEDIVNAIALPYIGDRPDFLGALSAIKVSILPYIADRPDFLGALSAI